MPCDSIELSRVEFLAKSTNLDLLADGLRAHGYKVTETATGLVISKYGRNGTYDAKTGRLNIPASWNVNEFKCAYSEQVVISQAEAHGWQLDWTTNENGEKEATVTKGI